jgi:hypothetical protein
MMTLHKDLALDRLAVFGNVAQFVAFRPSADGLTQSTSRIAGIPPNSTFPSIQDAVSTLFAASAEGMLNVRSYLPEDPRSREFVYGINSVAEVLDHLERLSAQGLHLIVNETIDIHDGGVSGVAQGDIVEFAPDDTPRAVEKPDIASFSREMGLTLLETVYGFAPELPSDRNARVEFSIHPARRGWRQSHTLLWELEAENITRSGLAPRWPNRFSRHIGDKCFGLLIANYLGAPVPRTQVFARRVAPFEFGLATGSRERWIRTCPIEPQPGRFTTTKGWLDPFELLGSEDKDREVASILAQAAIEATWSGAAIIGAEDQLMIEGRAGEGDAFMLGIVAPQALPREVQADVGRLHAALSRELGPVRIEWVHDGSQAWVVQLHVGATGSSANALVAGEADSWYRFEISNGLAAMRDVITSIPENVGLILVGDVGLTSHVADLARKWGRPTRIERG